MPCFFESAARGALALLAGLLAFASLPLQAQSTNPPPEIFAGDRPFRAVAYAFPSPAVPDTLPPLCALARDLPLIAGSGANVIYTEGIPPQDSDFIFLNLLASTGLSWVASFPLPDDLDPGLPASEQRGLILARFSEFAARFAGNRSLRGVALDFGKEHLAVSSLLANDFAAILEAHFPAHPPRLGHIAYTPAALDNAPAGVAFWLYRFENSIPTGLTRIQLKQRTSLPVVFDLSGVVQQVLAGGPPAPTAPGAVWKDYLSAFTSNDPFVPLLALPFLGERHAVTGAYLHPESALFKGLPGMDALESLHPTALTEAQRSSWEASPLEDHAAGPVIHSVRNPGTGTPYFSPGVRIEVDGSLFRLGEDTVSSEHWPLHASSVCLCVGDRPVPIGEMHANGILAQLPWLLATGSHEMRAIREGIASASQSLELRDYSPGIFADVATQTENACGITENNGLKAGEAFDVRVTGAGPLNGGAKDLSVFLDGMPLQVLDAGLESKEPGMALIRVRVPAKTNSKEVQDLSLRRGSHASNPLPVSYAEDLTPTVSLVASAASVQIQPNGSSLPIRIQTLGLNGYCGRVDFAVLGLPQGITATVPPVTSGQEATLQLRADSTAVPAQNHPFYVYGLPVGGDPQRLTLRLHVFPSMGPVVLTVESAGFVAGSVARIAWNGQVLAPTGEPDQRGLYLLVVSPHSGVFAPVERYDLWASEEESLRLETRLRNLMDGTIVAMAISDEATFEMQPSLREWIQAKLGSQAIAGLGYQHSWAIISTIGSAAPMAEAASAGTAVTAQVTLQLPN